MCSLKNFFYFIYDILHMIILTHTVVCVWTVYKNAYTVYIIVHLTVFGIL